MWRSARTWRPRAELSRYTMPQRETVAGEATARSSTSNSMVMLGDIRMISPDTRHSFLLSSSTCVEVRVRVRARVRARVRVRVGDANDRASHNHTLTLTQVSGVDLHATRA